MIKTFKLVVDKKLDGKRLDIAISLSELGLSRRKAKAIIDLGGGFLNRKRVRIASREVVLGDVIELRYDPENFVPKGRVEEYQLTAEDILYEDAGLIAINKPPGVPSQPTRSQAVYHVATLLEKYYGKKGFQLIHRLDQETTGILLIAKTKDAMNHVSEQLKGREVKKTYHALSFGIPPEKRFKEECYLSAIGTNGMVRPLPKGGKYSFTEFAVLKSDPVIGVSWIECYPLTGRSHQIRIHLAKNALPILGDKKYGDRKGSLPDHLMSLTTQHHMLHARELKFMSPVTNQPVHVTAPYPPNWKALLSQLGWSG